MYLETVFISKIADCSRTLENKDYGFGPRKIDLKDPGFLLVARSSGYRTYALTECHSGSPGLKRQHAGFLAVLHEPVLRFIIRQSVPWKRSRRLPARASDKEEVC